MRLEKSRIMKSMNTPEEVKLMIPKIIHYAWFGNNPLPPIAVMCIESWQKYCPDYEIKRWDESTYDYNANSYTREAYANKKYAFVTDYLRLDVLYRYGGIYMDTDVEVLRPLDNFLYEHAFSGFETNDSIPTGIMAAEKGNQWVFDQLQIYDGLHFVNTDGTFNETTNVRYITNLSLAKYGLKLNGNKQTLLYGMTLYPKDYFCPKDYETGKIEFTQNTYTIHHFNASWLPMNRKIKKFIREKLIMILGKDGYQWLKCRLRIGTTR